MLLGIGISCTIACLSHGGRFPVTDQPSHQVKWQRHLGVCCVRVHARLLVLVCVCWWQLLNFMSPTPFPCLRSRICSWLCLEASCFYRSSRRWLSFRCASSKPAANTASTSGCSTRATLPAHLRLNLLGHRDMDSQEPATTEAPPLHHPHKHHKTRTQLQPTPSQHKVLLLVNTTRSCQPTLSSTAHTRTHSHIQTLKKTVETHKSRPPNRVHLICWCCYC